MILKIKNLSKIYSKHIVACDNINLTIQKGEIFSMLGPNGAGKSTLIKILLGITRPSSGSATIFEIPISSPRSRQKIGYLSETHTFPTFLNAEEILRLFGQLRNMKKGNINQQIDYLLRLVELEKFRKIKIKAFSKGMLQRIGIAQALIADPSLILLDEPTDGIDPVGRIKIRNIITRLKDLGKTVFINSHLLSEVEKMADRVAILKKGKVLKVGNISTLTSKKDTYEINFSGSAPQQLPPFSGNLLSKQDNKFILQIDSEKEANALIQQLLQNQCIIHSFQPIKTSLEDLFVDTIK